MGLRLYVGNLPHVVQDEDLVDWVTAEGFKVKSARVIRDRATGQSRGFGFIELAPGEDVPQAIMRLDGMVWEGRTLHVNEARPETRDGGGGGGGAGGGGGRDRGGRTAQRGGERERQW